MLIISLDPTLKALVTQPVELLDEEEHEQAPIANNNNNDDDDEVDDKDNNNNVANVSNSRRRGKPKPSWKRLFFKEVDNRLECLLTPDPAPLKGATHPHENFLSKSGQVNLSAFVC